MGKKRKKRLVSWALIVLGFVLGVAFVFIFGDLWRPAPPPVKRPPVKATVPEPVRPEKPRVKVPEEVYIPVPEAPGPPVEKKARVAIVIDDMGQDLRKLKELFQLNAPITVAVLPNLRYSRETADETYQKGWDVLLHLPMEPKDLEDNNPGNGALLVSMTAEEVRKKIEDDLKTVPNASGVNNHMGSKFTEDEDKMRVVLDIVKKRDMFFLDSRTSSNSVAGRLARELGVRNADRNVFLDNTRDVKYIKGQISELVSIARKRGTAIAIGHPYPETIEALREAVPGLSGSVDVVRLSDLVK